MDDGPDILVVVQIVRVVKRQARPVMVERV